MTKCSSAYSSSSFVGSSSLGYVSGYGSAGEVMRGSYDEGTGSVAENSSSAMVIK